MKNKAVKIVIGDDISMIINVTILGRTDITTGGFN
jgi:hypothetical protein